MKNKNTVRIALLQMASFEAPEKNLEKAIDQIRRAAKKNAQILCLEELFRTRYFCQTEDKKFFRLAETIPGPTTKVLSKIAREEKIVLIVPLFEKAKKNIFYNTAIVLGPDGNILGKYRKMHIPEDPGFYEKFYFKPGNLGFRVIDTPFAKIAVFICWDQWFPEAARVAALAGAQIIFYPTAIGWKPEKKDELEDYHASWQCVQRSHAIANGVYVAAANRVGDEGGLRFWGRSFVTDPFGKVIQRASARKEELLMADCDLTLIEKIRYEWPFFRDRRFQDYRGILAR